MIKIIKNSLYIEYENSYYIEYIS